ncbi:hypothetical protein MCOR31_011814 [Pyricularia oryzae]|nr:hypothetical protein MCOR31_011814 [Pyricularia oryzae]
MEDSEKGIAIARKIVKTMPETHPDRALQLSNLAVQLNLRSQQGDRDAGANMENIKEAITRAREAVEATGPNHLAKPLRLNALGVALGERYQHSGDIKDLEEAIAVTKEAREATPQDHPNRPALLINLGLRLSDRYSLLKDKADLNEARICLKDATNTKSASIDHRVRAGILFLSLPDTLQDMQGAYAMAQTAVNLVPLLSPFSLQSADKQHQLRQVAGLASNAAAIALCAGQEPLAALQMLETGRGVLTGSLYNIRTDISGLKEKHPDLERDFVRLRNQLDAPTQLSDVDPDSRHKASAELDRLIDEIRHCPGFERFLLSATEDEMREAAVCGPIVVINVSSHRCDALIVEHSGLRVVGLAQLTPASLEEHAGDLGGAETLAWLWDVIVKPVLDALGITAPPAGNVWQHIWWIPTGILTRFPLHAAGHHHKHNAETTMDRVVSSYSPSIRSIIHTRRKQGLEKDADLGLNVVLVDMRETPGHSPLLYATVETKAVEKVCKSIGLRCDRPLAYKEDILAALESCEVLHFAGHGGTCPDPLRSFLLLKDWENSPLTVESLFERNLSARSRFLAYLSACGTGRIQDSSSVDESIHLTTAFQLAGFRHVIGTLWEVDDELCVHMAKLTYEYLAENGLSSESVSRALHHATKILRDRWVGPQLPVAATESVPAAGGPRDIEADNNNGHKQALWVPYVHFGA